ncbi:GFA family protein [Planktotalea sp.]|uniref:GFA family protein n=1 Tax=Planktotalea sp. TaxID=2029877 RepID=UPI003296A1C1
MKIKGSCVCGGVTFTISGAPSSMSTCHCSRCRKLGTSTIVFIERAQFTLLSGAAQIKTYEPIAPFKYSRSFCSVCGTSLGEPMSTDTSFPINAQCLDDDPIVRNAMHEFMQDAPCWAASVAAQSV